MCTRCRGGSSAGQSSGLIIRRSWVRAPPAPPAVLIPAARPAGCRRRCGVRTRGSTAPRTGGTARRAAGSSAAHRRRSAAPRDLRIRRREPRSDRPGPVDGEPFGQQESRPAHSRVLPGRRGHDRHRAPVLGRDQAVLPLSHRRCSTAVQTSGLPKAAGSSGRTRRAAACSQATSAPARSTVAPSRASVTSITMPPLTRRSSSHSGTVSACPGRQLPTAIAALASRVPYRCRFQRRR